MRLPSLRQLLFAPMRALVVAHLCLRRFIVEHLLRHSHPDPQGVLTPATTRLPEPSRLPFDVQAPLLALLPAPGLGLSKARVAFDQEVSFVSRRSGEGQPSLGIELHGTPAVASARRRRRRTPTVHVQLELTRTPAPEGLARIQDRLLRGLRVSARPVKR